MSRSADWYWIVQAVLIEECSTVCRWAWEISQSSHASALRSIRYKNVSCTRYEIFTHQKEWWKICWLYSSAMPDRMDNPFVFEEASGLACVFESRHTANDLLQNHKQTVEQLRQHFVNPTWCPWYSWLLSSQQEMSQLISQSYLVTAARLTFWQRYVWQSIVRIVDWVQRRSSRLLTATPNLNWLCQVMSMRFIVFTKDQRAHRICSKLAVSSLWEANLWQSYIHGRWGLKEYRRTETPHIMIWGQLALMRFLACLEMHLSKLQLPSTYFVG